MTEQTGQQWRNWEEIRAEEVAAGRLDEDAVAAEVARVRAVQRGCRFAELRKQEGWTQTDVAEPMGVSQARVSVTERGDVTSTETGTLAAYGEALGGHLELVADVGDQRLVIGYPSSLEQGDPLDRRQPSGRTSRFHRTPVPRCKSPPADR
jgi:DNA-binding XRE family transcriptional regulator